MTIKEARQLIDAIVSLRENADDATASVSVGVYPTLKENGALIKAGTRINWRGSIKRASVDVWDTPENNPAKAPGLWEDIEYREGCRIIPQTLTAGTAFSKGERGWWNSEIYVSDLDNNVWTPADYPQGWKKLN